MIRSIFLDMDGVLVDWDSQFIDYFGVDAETYRHQHGTTKMWKSLETDYPDFYRTLKPMPRAQELIELARSLTDDVSILTGIPSRRQWPRVENDKRQSVIDHFGLNLAVHIGPYSADKQKWATQERLLIDDRILNIEQFIQAGGNGIHYKTPDQAIKELAELTPLFK
jgi:FMN phosphatase YigB (HAD superfamily)